MTNIDGHPWRLPLLKFNHRKGISMTDSSHKYAVYAERRNNLTYLIDGFGGQSALERELKRKTLSQSVLKHKWLSQPILSNIELRKRWLRYQEARDIEQLLVIPRGWMDKPDCLRSGLSLIKGYRKLGEIDRKLFDEMSEFVSQYPEKDSNQGES